MVSAQACNIALRCSEYSARLYTPCTPPMVWFSAFSTTSDAQPFSCNRVDAVRRKSWMVKAGISCPCNATLNALFSALCANGLVREPRPGRTHSLFPWNPRYLPMQKLEKMRPSRSSEVNSPVISLSACCASRSSSASSSPA